MKSVSERKLEHLVRISNEMEAQQWCKYFNCTRNELFLALARVGYSPPAIQHWLKNYRETIMDRVSKSLIRPSLGFDHRSNLIATRH